MSIYGKLKKSRKLILFLCDFILWNVSFYFAFAICKASFLLYDYERLFISTLIVFNICFTVTFLLFRMYDKIWRYADIEDFFYAGLASVCANLLFFIVTTFVSTVSSEHELMNLGIRIYTLDALITTFLMFVFRFVYRVNFIIEHKGVSGNTKRRALIVGAGEASVLVLRELSKYADNEFIPICMVDDDREKIGRRISGVKVAGSTYEIPDICKNYEIEVIIFTICQASLGEKRRILDICAKTGLEVKIVPNIYDVLTNNKPVTESIRRVEVEDLLGREPIIFETEKYGEYLVNQNILVTGGGGSIGSELCRQIATLHPKNLIILDIYENNAYEIQQELKRKYGDKLNFEVEIASVRDREKLERIFESRNIDVVFHAAAHKHVPLMEKNPEEAVKNNVFGTLNVAELSSKYKVRKFVQISTDKAVNPTNIMGATKRICEMIIQLMDKNSSTEFVAVRFGNVLGSNGSVIPLFKDQIKNGGPVTVTHPDIIRYFMTIPEAVSLVLTAGGLAKGGEIFILDMGDAVKIKDLAENLIRLSGFKPGKDIIIEYTGLRPGEKLYEELLLDEEGIKKTDSEKIYIGKPINIDVVKFKEQLEDLKRCADDNDEDEIEKAISSIVPTFKHNKG